MSCVINIGLPKMFNTNRLRYITIKQEMSLKKTNGVGLIKENNI